MKHREALHGFFRSPYFDAYNSVIIQESWCALRPKTTFVHRCTCVNTQSCVTLLVSSHVFALSSHVKRGKDTHGTTGPESGTR